MLAWSPTAPLLVAGLANGSVASGRVAAQAASALADVPVSEDRTAHGAAITLVKFSPDGGRVVTGDASGLVVVWRVEGGAAGATGALTPLQTYRRAGSVAELTFLAYPGGPLPPPATGAAAALGDAAAQPLATLPPLSHASDAAATSHAGVATHSPGNAATAFLWASEVGGVAYGDDAGR